MPTTLNVGTSYAGQKAAGYVSAALLEGVTLGNGAIDIKQNVKYKEVMKTLSTSDDLIADGSCDFDATSTVTIAERFLEPAEMQVNLEFCKSSFASDWEAIELGYSAHENVPKTFSDYLIGHVAAKVAGNMETMIWQEETKFDGFEKILTDASDSVKVTGTAITADNVVTELGKVTDAIPARMFGNEGLTIFVSQNVAKAYIRALGGFGAAGLGANGLDGKGATWFNGQALSFEGYNLFVANGMSNDTMIAGVSDNFAFGTGLLSDHNEVRLLDMAPIDGSKNVRVIMRFTAGVQVGITADAVIYNS